MTKSTSSKVPRKLPRDSASGKFEPSSPLNDAALLRHAVEIVRATDTLTPVLLAFMHGVGKDPAAMALMRTTLCGLVFVSESVKHQLYVDAKSSSADLPEIDLDRFVSSIQADWAKVFAEIDVSPRLQSVPTDTGPT